MHFDEMTDEELMTEFQAGDPHAMEALLKRLLPKMAAIARKFSANGNLAEDALQEALTMVWKKAKQFNGDQEKTATWFKARNPLLGDVSPRDMIRLGRYDRLRAFIIQAMSDQLQAR